MSGIIVCRHRADEDYRERLSRVVFEFARRSTFSAFNHRARESLFFVRAGIVWN